VNDLAEAFVVLRRFHNPLLYRCMEDTPSLLHGLPRSADRHAQACDVVGHGALSESSDAEHVRL
jgi:hypothetical protein